MQFSIFFSNSGLDDEIKIWTPTSQTKVAKKDIEETVMKNADKSSQSIHDPGSIIGGQMLWQILRHIQRDERVRARVRKAICQLRRNDFSPIIFSQF